jgi:calpain, invertebrate
MMEIYRIQHMVQETKQEWCDPDFPANDNSLYMDPLSPPEYSSDIPNVEWKRPHEIFTSDEPVMMKDPDAPGDVKQGILNDTWLLGTFSAMGLNPELLKNLIVHDGIKFGFAVF